MDDAFVSLLVNYVSSKYSVPPPRVTYSDNAPARGVYVDSNLDTIILRSDATIFTVLHELAHKIFLYKGIGFGSEFEEEMAANNFAIYELSNLGLKLHPDKQYILQLHVEEGSEKLLSEILKSQGGLGIGVEAILYTPDTVQIVFKPYNPVNSKKLSGENVKYIHPIIWAIIALASIIGVAVTAWKIQEVTQVKIPEWVPPILILGLTVAGIFAVGKIAESLKPT